MKKLIRPKAAWTQLSVGKSKFYELVNAGRLRLVRLGPKSVAVVEHELDALIEELMAERDAKRGRAA
jgi:excisionase family DNA binding protein